MFVHQPVLASKGIFVHFFPFQGLSSGLEPIVTSPPLAVPIVSISFHIDLCCVHFQVSLLLIRLCNTYASRSLTCHITAMILASSLSVGLIRLQHLDF